MDEYPAGLSVAGAFQHGRPKQSVEISDIFADEVVELGFRVFPEVIVEIDLSAVLGRKTTAEEINATFEAAAAGAYRGIIEYVTAPLVSIDFRGNPHSAMLDSPYTKVMDDNFVKVVAWYDNEWGYSNRCVDLLKHMAARGL